MNSLRHPLIGWLRIAKKRRNLYRSRQSFSRLLALPCSRKTATAERPTLIYATFERTCAAWKRFLLQAWAVEKRTRAAAFQARQFAPCVTYIGHLPLLDS